jgi:hypothetical protein
MRVPHSFPGVSPLVPMSSGRRLSGEAHLFGVDDEGSEDGVGQSPLESPDGFCLVVPTSAASLQEGSGVRVVVRLSDCDAMDRGVELLDGTMVGIPVCQGRSRVHGCPNSAAHALFGHGTGPLMRVGTLVYEMFARCLTTAMRSWGWLQLGPPSHRGHKLVLAAGQNPAGLGVGMPGWRADYSS